MARKTINTNQLTPNDMVFIRGKLVWSNIAKPVEGEELQKEIRRNQDMKRRYYPTSPHTTIALHDARVEYKNPQMKTLFETYIEEAMYQSKDPKKSGWNYRLDATGTILPQVARREADGTTLTQIQLASEPAVGLDVTVILRVYQTRAGMNNGIAIDTVIINEPLVYRASSPSQNEMAERGLTFKPLPEDMKGVTEKAPVQEAPEYTANEYNNYGYTPEPVPAPQGNPYQNDYNAPQGNSPQDQGGIRWDPNNRNY